MNNPWQRKEVIGDCTLYLGDAMEIIGHLPKSALCASDIPYALTTGGKSKSSKTMSGIFAAHNYANDGQLIRATVPFPEMMNAIHANLDDDADCYVMANDKNVFELHNASIDSGFQFHNLLVWDKVEPTPNRWYMKNNEYTLYLWKGKAKTINFPSSKQTLRAGIRNLSKHPTEKPVSLMGEYIRNSSHIGDVVIDPFMGSGSTIVACAHMGRKGQGIEIDPQWFDVACQRVHEAYQAPSLFKAGAEKQTQDEMFGGVA